MLRNWGLVYQTSIEEHKHSRFKDFLTSTAWLTDTHMLSVFASTLPASALHLSSSTWFAFSTFKVSASPLDMWGLPIISTVDRKHESSQRGKKNSCFSACQILQDGCAGRQFSSDLCQIWKNKRTCTHTLLAVAHGETRGPALHGSGVYSSQAQRTRSSEGPTRLQRCPSVGMKHFST